VNSQGFEIVEFIKHKSNHKSSFYAIKLDSETKSEADAFFDKFENTKKEEIEILSGKIDYMVTKRGCLESFFELKESKIDDNICCLKAGKLRLYCLRYSKVAVILGGGDFKDVNTYQESEDLNKHVKLLQVIYALIDERIKDKEIIITENSITGKLKFNL